MKTASTNLKVSKRSQTSESTINSQNDRRPIPSPGCNIISFLTLPWRVRHPPLGLLMSGNTQFLFSCFATHSLHKSSANSTFRFQISSFSPFTLSRMGVLQPPTSVRSRVSEIKHRRWSRHSSAQSFRLHLLQDG